MSVKFDVYDYSITEQKPDKLLGSEFMPGPGQKVLDQGDRCYGILDGQRLISFGWYSYCPTAIGKELVIEFDPHYVYMYKGYTDPDYRGQSLHALGMAQATLALVQEGYKGLVSYVEANNFASLHSCERLGYHPFGRIRIVRIFNWLRIFVNQDCSQYGFGIRRTSVSARRWLTKEPAIGLPSA